MKTNSQPGGRRSFHLRENAQLYLIMLPVLLHIFIFSYIPMYGIIIAFQDYFPGKPFFSFTDTNWVGFKHFIEFFNGPYFGRLMRNTFSLSFYFLVFGFWVPILFAVLLNELKSGIFKKYVQTASYLPHFISNVVVAGMVLSFINTDGIINTIVKMFGGTPVAINTEAGYFPAIYTITSIWKSFGWSSILYLAAMSSVDPHLYEAAKMDGANRLKQILHISLPSIRPTILFLLIFAIGSLFSANSEFILLIYNPMVYETADVIGTYLYRDGLLGGQFSLGTAVGLFISVINFTLLYFANTLSRKYSDYALW
ncbi:ABC transporter permease subunit [Paenibacillus sp. chi10]|uniref:ABC transporter permease subunit n=2 Tax=Paenibacillus TaxID=44249 RepID=A0AAJ2K041_9BACL|nr:MULTISPECIES: ABC transporter permease subunit [unclassified Paenibacillus]EPY14337.1 ABC transporter integral membrane subunit [Paenibacillus alvei A6-6i-x]MDT8979547.1 ABC transporter permease subunit [Paenibacillus sp. chi10]